MKQILLLSVFALLFASCRTIEYRDVHSHVHDTTSVYVEKIMHDTAYEKVIVKESGDTVYRERYVAKYIRDTVFNERIATDTCYIEKEVVRKTTGGKWNFLKGLFTGILLCFAAGGAMTLYYSVVKGT